VSTEQDRPGSSPAGEQTDSRGGIARYLVPTTLAVAALAAILFLLFPPGGGGLVARWFAPKPHILLILADDMGWNDVGFHLGDVSTPNLDRLAKEGVDLEGLYTLPLCTQTRAAIMTGRYPFRYGLQHGVIRLESEYGLPLTEHLMPEELKEVGYGTYLIGKWHLGHHAPEYLPMARGFDYHYGNYCAGVDYFTHTFMGVPDWHKGAEPAFEEGYATTLLTEEAVRVVEEHDASKPMFLELAYTAPHTPVRVPPSALQISDPSEDPTRTQYKAAVTEMDKGIGEVIAALEKKQMIDDTIIVFLSDNGGEESNGADNKPYRGGKGTESAYDAGMRVPALVWWKNSKIKPGLVIRAPVHAVDLTATLLALAGAERTDMPLDGQDLWKYLTGRKEVEARELPLVISPKRQVVRYGDWKLIQGVATATITTSTGVVKQAKSKLKKRETTAVTPGAEPGKNKASKNGKSPGSGVGSGSGAGKMGKGKMSKAKAKAPSKAKAGGTTADSGTSTTGNGDAGSDIEIWNESIDGGDGGGDAGSDASGDETAGFESDALFPSDSIGSASAGDLAQNTTSSGKAGKHKKTTGSGSGSGSSSGSSEKIVIELYDLSIDPAESVNLADKRPDKLKELQAIASKYLVDSVAPFADITLSPEASPTLSPGWKYPRIVGVFGEQDTEEPAAPEPATPAAAGSGAGATP
jgi:arylsulfatase A-like enzyme